MFFFFFLIYNYIPSSDAELLLRGIVGCVCVMTMMTMMMMMIQGKAVGALEVSCPKRGMCSK